MLKARVIACLTLYEGVLTRTKNFRPDYRYTHNFVDMEHLDELVILDITPGRDPHFLDTVEQITRNYFGPLSLGGGIHTAEQAVDLIRWGCEKVVVKNIACCELRNACDRLGSQSIVGAVDYTHNPKEKALWFQGKGAGEILLQNVMRDGSLAGYDLAGLREVVSAVSVPVVISTGCGTWQHMRDAFRSGASGAATACVFHWTSQSMKSFKDQLRLSRIPIR